MKLYFVRHGKTEWNLEGRLQGVKRRAKPMSIVDFIAVVSFGITCFCAGYTFGKDNNKPQK